MEDVVVNLLRLAAVRLPQDVEEAIRNAYDKESSLIGKMQLGAILENIRLAEEQGIPLCQDTGLVSYYLKAGSEFGGLDEVESVLFKATQRATREVPLRPNSVDPFTQKNTNDNTGRRVPYIHWEIVSGDFLEITVFPKGAGSENASVLKMMKPNEGLKGLKKFLIQTVVKAGGMPCPPTIIGIGIGGGANVAMDLAKISLIRSIKEFNPDKSIAKLERELCEAVNRTGIGPMGLGGGSTTLSVKIEHANRHPASYPVALAFQCWAARRATARIYANGEVDYLTHKI